MNEPARNHGFEIEPIGTGFTVVDYSGRRGRFGAAYADARGVWHSQPMAVREPFPSEAAARQWARDQSQAPS